jgi:hypothetical protein
VTDLNGALRRQRPLILTLLCLGFLVTVGVVAQTAGTTPLNPVSLQPQPLEVAYVWNSGAYGTGTLATQGTTTAFGTTLRLNTITTDSPASAIYSLSFIDLRDLHGFARNFTLYIPNSLTFASNSTPLQISIANQKLDYYATQPTHVSWYPTTVYVPANSTFVQLPASVSGPNSAGAYLYIPLNFSSATLSQNTSVTLTVTVPAHGQIYIPDLILSAVASFQSYVPTTSRDTGLVTLPFTVATVVGVFYFLRRFGAWRYAGTLAAGFCLRVGLASVFMHPDLSTLARYSQLYYNYHVVNLQTWIYGLTWYASIVLPAAPSYAAGISPSAAEWDLLLKLPGIVADILTFLVIIRILAPRLGENRAYWVGVIGWLFNPMVIYFSSLHGLGESVVALLLSLTAYFLLSQRTWWGVGAAIGAAVTIISTAFVYPAIVLSRRVSWPQRAVLILVPILAYILVFVALYHSTDGITQYFQRVGLRTSQSGLVLGAATTSPMTFLWFLNVWLQVGISPLIGLAILIGACLVLWLHGMEGFPEQSLLMIFASMAAFYFTYEVFYVQHFVWALPLAACLVALAPRVPTWRACSFILAFSGLALLINYGAFYRLGYEPTLSIILFAWMLVPIILWLPPGWIDGRSASRLTTAVRVVGIGLALFLAFTWAGASSTFILGAILAGVTAAAFAFVSWLPTLRTRTAPEYRLLVEEGVLLAIVLPLVLLVEAPRKVPESQTLCLLALAACSAYEIVRHTTELLSQARAPVSGVGTAPRSAPAGPVANPRPVVGPTTSEH